MTRLFPPHLERPLRRRIFTRFAPVFAGLLGAAMVVGMTAESRAQGQVGSHIVVDMFTKKILNGKDVSVRRQIASITKVATAIVVLDWARLSGTDLGVQALVPQSAGLIGGASPLGLRPGDRIELRDALYSTLMGSDNVAAETLAAFVGFDLLRRVGKSGDPVAHFVEQMNALAAKHGLSDTKFVNPHGMDHRKPVPYSTAADVARLCIVAMESKAFPFYVDQVEREIGYFRGGRKLTFKITNTNQLVAEKGIDGIKTGQTNSAGPCVAITAEKPSVVQTLSDGQKQIIPHRLIVVVLGAQNRFQVASALLADGWRRFDGWNNAGRPVNAPEELLSGGAAARQ